MTNARFLSKIEDLFISLTAAMLYHSLCCWKTEIFIDKVAFMRSNTGAKINYVGLQFSRVCTSPLTKISLYSRKLQVLNK